jgi:hypothetical protein
MVRGLIVLSTNIAGTPRSATTSAMSRISATPASDSVEMPWMPETSMP